MRYVVRWLYVLSFAYLSCTPSATDRQSEQRVIDVKNSQPIAIISPPVPVTSPTEGAHFWWSLRASPASPDKMVICAIRNSPTEARPLENVLYGSNDGGLTWRELIVDNESYTTSESQCGISDDDTIYFASSRMGRRWQTGRESNRVRSAAILRSDDFGGTWRHTEIPHYLDSAMLLIGKSKATADDYVGILFNGFSDEELVSRTLIESADSAKSFETPSRLPRVAGDRGKTIVWLADALFLRNGSIGSVWLDPVYPDLTKVDPEADASTRITYNVTDRFASSRDPAVVVATLSQEFVEYVLERQSIFLQRRWPSIAAGPLPGDPHHDRIYVAWHDLINNRVRIHIATSDDNGNTWSSPRVIDDLPANGNTYRGSDAARPSVAVNQFGVVAVQWSEVKGICWRVSISLDGGRTFGPSVKINECAPYVADGEKSIGKYLSRDRVSAKTEESPAVNIRILDWRRYWALNRNSSIAARADGGFQSSWASSDSEHSFGIFTASLTTPIPMTYSCPEKGEHLQSMEFGYDPPGVRLEYASLEYDSKTSVLSIGIVPVMRDATYISAQILRLDDFKTVLGPIEAANADNGLKRAGAAWVFPNDGPNPSIYSSAVRKYQEENDDEIKLGGMRILRFRVLQQLKGRPMPAGTALSDILLFEAVGEFGVPRCTFLE